MSEVEKILLVDDEPGIRESVQAYLSCNENWQIEVARDVNERRVMRLFYQRKTLSFRNYGCTSLDRTHISAPFSRYKRQT